MQTTETTPGSKEKAAIPDRKLPYLVVAWAGNAPLDAKRGPSLIGLRPGLVLGRGRSVEEPRLLSDATLSREHVRFDAAGDSWLVQDLGSRNGTLVDGERIAQATVLRDGAIIFIGSHVLVYRWLSKQQIATLRSECATATTGTPTFSAAAAESYQRVRRLAEAELDLFISGETGTGKEVLARAVHDLSGRKGAFVALNCAALPEALVESELFGFRRGAHSAAREGKIGLLEAAREGTLFLDELGESTSSMQAKLLRFLQDRTFTPLGATASLHVNTRIIGASHRRNLVGAGDGRGLRPDLAHRLGPEPIVLPSLRERIEDVAVLAESFLRPTGKRLSDEAMRRLFLCAWEGNIRQLGHRLRYAAAVAHNTSTIEAEHLPGGWVDQEASSLVGEDRHTSERPLTRATPGPEEIEAILRKTGGDVAAAARLLGRQRTLVWKWLRRFGIDPVVYRLAP